jgi:hypothetical protein
MNEIFPGLKEMVIKDFQEDMLKEQGQKNLDENGKDTNHWAYGHSWKDPDQSERNRKAVGEKGWNWKGGISSNKKEYDAMRWRQGVTTRQRKI